MFTARFSRYFGDERLRGYARTSSLRVCRTQEVACRLAFSNSTFSVFQINRAHAKLHVNNYFKEKGAKEYLGD